MEALSKLFEDALQEDYEEAMEVKGPAPVAKQLVILKSRVIIETSFVETKIIAEISNANATAAVNHEEAQPLVEPKENVGSNVPVSRSSKNKTCYKRI